MYYRYVKMRSGIDEAVGRSTLKMTISARSRMSLIQKWKVHFCRETRFSVINLLTMIKKIRTPSLWVLIALGFVALPAGYVGTSVANGSVAAQALIADPMSVFSARSPGARGTAALTSTKTAFVRTGPAIDDFWGMGPGLSLPKGGGLTVQETPTGLSQGDNSPQDAEYSEFSIPAGLYGPGESGPFFGVIGEDSGFGLGVPGGGVSGFGPKIPGGGGGVPPPLPPSAVPEPEMWLMMIFGFFAIGSVMRTGNRLTFESSL